MVEWYRAHDLFPTKMTSQLLLSMIIDKYKETKETRMVNRVTI